MNAVIGPRLAVRATRGEPAPGARGGAGAGAPSQAEIAAVTALAPATVSNIVRVLCREGLLEATQEIRSGRRARAVRLVRGAGLVAGIDFGHRHVRVALADLADPAGHAAPDPDHDAPPGGPTVLAQARRSLPDGHGATGGLAEAGRLLDALLARMGSSRASLRGAVVGLPAPLDQATGAVGASGVLPGWVACRPRGGSPSTSASRAGWTTTRRSGRSRSCGGGRCAGSTTASS